MNDIITRTLKRAITKGKTDTCALQRYFRIRFNIHVTEEVLQKRILFIK